jgi:hypothetical protein
MSREKKFMDYLDSLKGTKSEKLIECVQEGFKTLVEYQVVGNMSERGVDLMEGEDIPEGVPTDLVELIEKLTREISELQGAMQDIDDIADTYEVEVPEESSEEACAEEREPVEEACYDERESVEEACGDEREPVDEALVRATDGVIVPVSAEGQAEADSAYEKASKKEESGGSLEEVEPQAVPDVDPRDIDGIETGQRLGKVEGYEGYEGENMPENIRRGESAGNEPEGESEINDKEGKMANKQLDQIHDQAGKLAGSFTDDEELKAWVQAKITKAHQTLDVIYEYFRDEKELDEKPEHKRPEELDDMDNSPENDEKAIFEK